MSASFDIRVSVPAKSDSMTQSTHPPVKVLFVCVGNACRSQMAEAWANHFGKDSVQALSAGTYPYGSIVDDTSAAMSEKGISVEGQWSKGLRAVPVADMDIVVRMGREVAVTLPADFKGHLIEWNIPDPYGCGMETFRTVRDMIGRQVLVLLADLLTPEDPV
jgi:arsenate reductase